MRTYYCFTAVDAATMEAAISAHMGGGRVMQIGLFEREAKVTNTGFVAQARVPGAHAIAIFDEALSREALLALHAAGVLLSASDLFPGVQDDAERVTEIPPEPVPEPESEIEAEADEAADEPGEAEAEASQPVIEDDGA